MPNTSKSSRKASTGAARPEFTDVFAGLYRDSFANVAELVEALREFKRTYNERWLIGRHGFRSPRQVRLDSLAASEGLDAGPTCRRVG